MKKLLALLLFAAVALSFTACNKTETSADAGALLNPFNATDNSDTQQSDEKVSSEDGTVTDAPASSAPESSEPSSTAPSSSAPSSSAPSSSTPSSTPPSSVPSTPAPSNPAPSTPATNSFINSSNNYVSAGDLAIRPYRVYWEGNVLHAECFVVNGLPRTAYNITVENITLANRSGVIASARFGVMQNASVAPGGYIVWTFSFAPDVISMQGADLSYLECDTSANYRY